MQAETEEPQQEETEETEETEEPTDQDHGERAHRSGASGKKTGYVSPQTRAIFDTYHNATVGIWEESGQDAELRRQLMLG